MGNSAAVFPLQRIGHEVWPVHTVLFSNHTGYGAWRGPVVPPDDVHEVILGMEERGALAEVDLVLSGYQGSPGIADVVLDAVERVKAANPAAAYACDPVMGNADSGCFVDPAIPPAAPGPGGPPGRRDHPEPVRAGRAGRRRPVASGRPRRRSSPPATRRGPSARRRC